MQPVSKAASLEAWRPLVICCTLMPIKHSPVASGIKNTVTTKVMDAKDPGSAKNLCDNSTRLRVVSGINSTGNVASMACARGRAASKKTNTSPPRSTPRSRSARGVVQSWNFTHGAVSPTHRNQYATETTQITTNACVHVESCNLPAMHATRALHTDINRLGLILDV
eukprot:4329116-Amphidinium_carterae.1